LEPAWETWYNALHRPIAFPGEQHEGQRNALRQPQQTITDTGYWMGGTMFGSGQTIIDTNAVLTIDTTNAAAGVKLDTRTLVNRGTINWYGVTGPINLVNKALIDNQSTGVFNTAGGGTQIIAGTTGRFRNAGTLYIGGAPWGTTGILNIAGTFT
jgi:hypothetical protein